MGVVVWFQFPAEIETPGWGFIRYSLILGLLALEELGFLYEDRLLLKPHFREERRGK